MAGQAPASICGKPELLGLGASETAMPAHSPAVCFRMLLLRAQNARQRDCADDGVTRFPGLC
jgi:hypothetical protein